MPVKDFASKDLLRYLSYQKFPRKKQLSCSMYINENLHKYL